MIDLRSDTVTAPSAAMREVIATAPVGDDVYGDDPTVNALEERVAELFGKEAGLFTPTGSLSNQLMMRTLVEPGQEILAETNSHVVRAELGAAATFSGITSRTWLAPSGLLDAADPLSIAAPNAGPYLVSTAAIAVENSHNFGGGTVQPLHQLKSLYEQAHAMGIAIHLDGARIWNAHVASGVSLAQYGAYADTISVCFSKGLGAPIGSMALSTRERIASARIWRKRYGAGMRQVGLLAAAADYAITHHIADLKEDHRRAQELATAIAQIDSSLIDPSSVSTNIVGLDLKAVGMTAAELARRTKESGLLIGALGPYFARLVTHRDFDDTECAQAIEILRKTLVSQ
jgi:threonine aldolase